MTPEEHDALVEQSIRERKAAKEANHTCPVCGEPGLLPLGGPGHYWFEHGCGAYSPLRATLEECLEPIGWELVEPGLSMHPPVGG